MPTKSWKWVSISIDLTRGLTYHLQDAGGCVEEQVGGPQHVGGGVVHLSKHTFFFAEVFKPNPLE